MNSRLNFVDIGHDDPAIVFIHGFTCALSDWNAQLPALSGRNRCVAVDLPGHGSSAASPEATIQALAGAVNETLDRLALKRVVLVGHSMGCRIVSETYTQAPDRVCGVVYVDGSMLADGDPDAASRAASETIERLGMAGVVARIYEGFFVEITSAAVRAPIDARRAAIDLDFARRLWLDLVRWDASRATAALSKVNVPALVIQSTYLNTELKRVSLVPGQSAPWPEAVSKAVKDVTYTVISGVGHFPMSEAPRETNAAIAGFVRRLCENAT